MFTMVINIYDINSKMIIIIISYNLYVIDGKRVKTNNGQLTYFELKIFFYLKQSIEISRHLVFDKTII